MLTYDNPLIPDNHTGKPSSKRFQLQFSTYHKTLVRTNENQSIITLKVIQIFQEKSHHELQWSDETLADSKDCISDSTGVISKFIVMKFRKPPGNINYLTFTPSELKYVICFEEGKIEAFFRGEWFCRSYFHRGTIRGGLNRGAEAGCFMYWH